MTVLRPCIGDSMQPRINRDLTNESDAGSHLPWGLISRQGDPMQNRDLEE